LRRALAQLEHERAQLKLSRARAPGDAAREAEEDRRAEYLAEHLLGLARAMREIARGAEQQVADLQQEIAALQPQLAIARRAVLVATERLTALVQAVGRPPGEWPAQAAADGVGLTLAAAEAAPCVVLPANALDDQRAVADEPRAAAPAEEGSPPEHDTLTVPLPPGLRPGRSRSTLALGLLVGVALGAAVVLGLQSAIRPRPREGLSVAADAARVPDDAAAARRLPDAARDGGAAPAR
jgi:hypothetical protein